jgi:hypothetical protein
VTQALPSQALLMLPDAAPPTVEIECLRSEGVSTAESLMVCMHPTFLLRGADVFCPVKQTLPPAVIDALVRTKRPGLQFYALPPAPLRTATPVGSAESLTLPRAAAAGIRDNV